MKIRSLAAERAGFPERAPRRATHESVGSAPPTTEAVLAAAADCSPGTAVPEVAIGRAGTTAGGTPRPSAVAVGAAAIAARL